MKRLPALGSLALVSALLVTAPAAAGEGTYRFEQLSLAAGLSQVTVLAIHEDTSGRLWFGTEDGLNRLEGDGFVAYRHDAADPGSLPASYVRAITEDGAGRLWLGTEGAGLATFDPDSGISARFVDLHDKRSAALSTGHVQALLTDRDGALWIGLRDGGLSRLDPATGEVVHFRHDRADATSLASDRVLALAEGADGTLWVGTDAGLDRLDLASRSFDHLRRHRKEPAVRALLSDRAGTLWIATQDRGLERLDPATGTVTAFRHDPEDPSSLADDRVRALFEDADGTLWVGTLAGLQRLERESGRFVRLDSELAAAGLDDPGVLALHRDRAGQLWVGTHFAGVARGTTEPAAAATLRPVKLAVRPLTAGTIVTAFAEDAEGRILIGTFGDGVRRIDPVAGETTYLRHDPRDAGSLSDDRVTALLADRGGRLWVGTKDAGLNRIDSTGELVRYRHRPGDATSLPADGVTALFQDAAGAIWVGTYGGGLARLDEARDGFATFRADATDAAALPSDRVISIGTADAGRLWIGTDGAGLALLDPGRGVVARFTHDPADAASLPGDTVLAVYDDGGGSVWVGTRGGGLAQIELPARKKAAPRFRVFTEDDGLPNDVVYAIRPDHQGGLWLSTNLGLSRFDPRSWTFMNFDARHGLQGNEFNFGASLRSSTGELYFGGVNGYDAFYPEHLMAAGLTLSRYEVLTY